MQVLKQLTSRISDETLCWLILAALCLGVVYMVLTADPNAQPMDCGPDKFPEWDYRAEAMVCE